ncbi:hypothetical protein ACNF49_29735 [Actinomadura sp. ATCC 39365]
MLVGLGAGVAQCGLDAAVGGHGRGDDGHGEQEAGGGVERSVQVIRGGQPAAEEGTARGGAHGEHAGSAGHAAHQMGRGEACISYGDGPYAGSVCISAPGQCLDVEGISPSWTSVKLNIVHCG